MPFCLVADKRPVEVDGEDNKDDPHGDHDHGGDEGRLPARVAARLLDDSSLIFQNRVHRQELDPAKENDLGEEEEDAQDSGEAPRQLDVRMHALVGGLADGVQVVDVTYRFHIGQDASADEKGEEVDSDQNGCAGTEGDQQHLRVLVLHLQLDFHHGHLKSIKVSG